jgi:hypothetical protein
MYVLWYRILDIYTSSVKVIFVYSANNMADVRNCHVAFSFIAIVNRQLGLEICIFFTNIIINMNII